MALVKEIRFNVTLTTEQVERIREQIVNKNNRVSGCQYAGIRTDRLDKILEGATLKNDERDLLMKFCDIVEGVSQNEE